MIPIINIPDEYGWGKRQNIVKEYLEQNSNAISTSKNVIEISGSWGGVNYKAWLMFSRFLHKLRECHIGFPELTYENDKLRSEAENYTLTNALLSEKLGEPYYRKGLSTEDLKSLNNIYSVNIEALPHVEWTKDRTIIIHRFIDHWGFVPQLKLCPK